MGSYLSTPNTNKESSDDESARFIYGASAMQGWRTGMEDAHITELALDDKTALFGVFDGHGGKEVALFCQRYFAEEMKKLPSYQSKDFGQAIIDTYLLMDERIDTLDGKKELRKIRSSGNDEAAKRNMMKKLAEDFGFNREGMDLNFNTPDDDALEQEIVMAGCTAVVAVVHENNLFVGNAGDSRCVLCRDGKAVAMSMDHKPELPSERSRIVSAGGSVSLDGRVNGNLNLSRAIGDLEYKKNPRLRPEQQIITAYPEIRVEQLTDKDEFLVLACDGVWDVMTNQEVCDFVRERLNRGMKVSSIVNEIFDRCISPDPSATTGVGCDNMTCVIVVFKRQ
eukprot:GILI01002328.1.p1 GENE.GILI01002328.1~~GILI01002328.1.p1  ORF type:complete len:338 (+),score=109.19 GILI01002328.1:70-1083(+)